MTIRIERLRARRSTLRVDLQRFLPSFILAGYGIFILSLFARHIMSWYINPGYIGPTTLAGGVLVGLAVVRLTQRFGSSCEEDGCCGSDACTCGDAKPRVWTYLVLAAPLLLALIFPTRGLASFSANQRGPQIAGMTVVHGATTVRRVSLSVDTGSFSLQDWVGALSADPNPKDYAGKTVNLTGMVIHSPASVPPGYVMVLRYQVTCCIADARPVGLIVRDISHGALQDNQWVTVHGTMGAASYQGQQVAVINPKQIVPTNAGNPYMY